MTDRAHPYPRWQETIHSYAFVPDTNMHSFRSLSTVFERPFLQRPQEFHVIHEPFVPIIHDNKHKDFEFLNRIPLPKSTDPITFVNHLSPILNEILAPHYYNEDKTHTLRAFVKDHAIHFLQVAEGTPLLSKEILSMFKHTFLIRNPEKSVKSFYKAMNATNEARDKSGVSMSGKIEISSWIIGLKQLRILYDLIKNAVGEEIALVDADDLVQKPEKILRKYCEMINVEFKKRNA
ncbi:branched-chain-amino-acid aminotransferase-like protein 1 [Gigaspora margarita]|uniref:Branched-chain-amino-acid aminotransferase-like protein 1 n=1 Tax=Gigaspora margarita TaxID=4874 RepID=A0A8H4A1X4_GIGMA|nr:branched-chain-amino-acid aminotransferase-like protein 1 [Gigaspora margarita]